MELTLFCLGASADIMVSPALRVYAPLRLVASGLVVHLADTNRCTIPKREPCSKGRYPFGGKTISPAQCSV